MRRALLLLAAVAMMVPATGCLSGHHCAPRRGTCADCPDVCRGCGVRAQGGWCGGCAGRAASDASMGMAGAAGGTVTYPYYTTRGPRDYLARDPMSIGP